MNSDNQNPLGGAHSTSEQSEVREIHYLQLYRYLKCVHRTEICLLMCEAKDIQLGSLIVLFIGNYIL